MALPTTGISTSLVATAIGEASSDVGTLCSSPKINKWSKWKPIWHPKTTGLILSDLEAENFGILVYEYTYFNDLLVAMGGTGEGMASYRKPLGGVSSPYRLGDFRNYEHYAPTPMGTGAIAASLYGIKDLNVASAKLDNTDCFIRFKMNFSDGADGHGLTFYDMYPAEATYLGVRLFNTDPDQPNPLVYVCGADRTSVLVNWNHTVLKSWNNWAEVRLTFFLTNSSFATSTTPPDGTGKKFWPLPTDNNNFNPFLMYVRELYDYNPQEFAGGLSMYSGGYYDLSFYADGIYNGSPHTGGDIEAAFLQTSDYSDFSVIRDQVEFPDMYLPAGQRVNYTGSISIKSSGTTYYRLLANTAVLQSSQITV